MKTILHGISLTALLSMSDFKHLRRDQIDDERWNATVRSDPFFRHYALTYFLDACGGQWTGLVGPAYSWVWPLPILKFPVSRVYQPLLAQQLGPFGTELSTDRLHEIWDWLSKEYWQLRIKFNQRYPSLPGKVVEHRNVELDLNTDLATLHSSYNRNVQSNLKKAAKNQVSVGSDPAFDPWSLHSFQEGRGQQLKQLDQKFFKQVETIYRAFEAREEARTYTAYHQGVCVAQVMLLSANHRLLLFFSASNEEGRKVGAMHAILNKIIEDHAGASAVFDFEGSDNDQLAFFYRGFGGTDKVYLQAETSRLFWPLNVLIK